MRHPHRICFAFLVVATLAASLVASPAWAQSRDRIFLSKGGAAPAGKITERSKDKVVIETANGKVQNYPTNDIVRIVFEGEPNQLSRAKDSIAQGQYDQATKELSEVAQSSLTNDEMIEEYKFYRAYLDGALALIGQGNSDTSSKALLDWAKKYPKSHNIYKASEMLGDLSIANGVPDQATRYYGLLAGSNYSDLKLKGSFLQGKALMLQGKFSEATEKLSSVAQERVADPALIKIQKLALIASIRCEAASGKVAESIAKLEKMVDDGDSADAVLFAELYNALGAIFSSQNNDYEALLSYLKTDILYSSQPDPHAEALYNLAKLWEKIGEQLKATDAKSRLSKLYPTSPWVKK
jgi:tetratricopeptide (TPR) repeat protein